MPITMKSRKSRFLNALEAAGLSQAAWARKNGISPAHLSLVLSGQRDSGALTAKIDEFILKHVGSKTALTQKASAA